MSCFLEKGRKRKQNQTSHILSHIFLRLCFHILKSGQPGLCLSRVLAGALQASFCCACQEKIFKKDKSKIDFNSKERFSQISFPLTPSCKAKNSHIIASATIFRSFSIIRQPGIAVSFVRAPEKALKYVSLSLNSLSLSLAVLISL